jgi:hypothetical protein
MKRYLLLLLSIATVAVAEWPCSVQQNVAIVTAAGNQWNSKIISDGKSGAIVVWQDRRHGSIDKLYVQHINSAGDFLWQPEGVPLSSGGGYQYNPDIIADGNGGAFIVWQDNRSSSSYDIYAQHISSEGNLLWNSAGVVVSSAAGHQYNPKVVADGAGGIIVVWQDKRSSQYDVYAQRLNVQGEVVWQQDGVAVCTAAADQIEPKIIQSGDGGVIIAWTDYQLGTGSPDIFAQKLTSNGNRAWLSEMTDGVPVCTASNAQWIGGIVRDGGDGAIVCWQDRRVSASDKIYAQRLDGSGTSLWTPNGVELTASSGIQYYPKVAGDGSGGAIIVWQDNRRGNDFDIYAQRIDSSGIRMWASEGQAVCTVNGHQYNPQVIVDKSSVLVSWQDKRNGIDFDIYGQMLTLGGQVRWGMNGVPIAVAASDQILPEMTSDLVQGFIICWTDYRSLNGYTDVYSHRVGANGKLAGGCYRSFTQENFSVKGVRYVSRLKGGIAMPNGGNVRDSVFRRGVFQKALVVGIDRSDSTSKYVWQLFTRAVYIRRALPQTGTPRPYIIERSFVGPKKNYSVSRYNNSLVGELIALKLNIGASDAGITSAGFGDLKFYNPFVPSHPLNNLSLRAVARYCDSLLTMWRWYRNINYSQIDSALKMINRAFSGNIDTNSSVPLSLKPVAPLFSVSYLIPSAEETSDNGFVQSPAVVQELPETYFLLQNYPNPFNPFTTIEFNLLEPSYTSLKIYNVLGQEIATLIDHSLLDEGEQFIDFDGSALPSGVYFYHLTIEPVSSGGGAIYSFVNKMVLIK